VPDTRELFDEHFEADVLYERRFLIDTKITTGVRVDTSATRPTLCGGDKRVDVSAVSPCDRPDVAPRVCTVDIEVASEDGFPDAQEASDPVVSIVAHDSYSDEYTGWLLRPDNSDVDLSGVCSQTHVFDDEDRLLDDFNSYVDAYEPDILTGWFSNDFDFPYLIQRCRELSVWSYFDWSPLDECYTTQYGPVADGLVFVDMLGAYEKTQIHNLKDKSLDAVAEKELDDTKLDVADGYTEMWRNSPVEFFRYNKVDVELVTRINEAAEAIQLLTSLRDITGVQYDEPIGGNFEIMDTTFLRHAQERDICLPSASKPDVTDYHGAYVYEPVPGIHETVVYPDYSSLYPYMMYQCNMSPETLIGTADELDASAYTEDDCVWTYVDTQTAPEDKENVEADESRMEKLYFVSSDIDAGFVREVLDDVMGMADQYSGKKYEAVKRVRNSTYGFLGDSDSYGRGSRLYDWRVAEGITLGGQRVLKAGAEQFAERVADSDAEVIYGDTDAAVTTLPNTDLKEAIAISEDAADAVNDWLDGYCRETFNCESMMQLEIESLADKIYLHNRKKRYAQRIIWNDDEGWVDDSSIDIKGLEAVRSDVADVTVEAQQQLLQLLLTQPLGEAIDEYSEYLRDLLQRIETGEYPLDKLAQTAGIGQPLDEYGSVDRTPQPQYRGARYANQHIYNEDAIGEGDRPLWLYVSRVRGMPRIYSADTAEDGQKVDAIAVLEADDLPDGITVDTDKMIEKTIKDPVGPILNNVGHDYDELISPTDQTDVLQFM